MAKWRIPQTIIINVIRMKEYISNIYDFIECVIECVEDEMIICTLFFYVVIFAN